MSPKVISILDVSDIEWKINTKEFNSILDKVGHRPLAIYSINGATRSGKSFLLNYFIRYFESLNGEDTSNPNSYFEWNSELKPVTIGIKLWSQPYFVKTDEGEVAVLLMDTQGLFDGNTTYRQNAIVFALSCLLSSVMIYNQNHLVTDDVLQTIQCFSSLANNIVYQYDREKTTVANFNIGCASKLMFLLRDFDRAGYTYGLHTATDKPSKSKKNYFNDVLNVGSYTEGVGTNYPEENRVTRERIHEMFPLMASYLLPHPGKQFTREEVANPDEEFQEYAKTFVETMISKQHLVKKNIGGQFVSGKQFKESILYLKTICKQSEEYFADAKSPEEFRITMAYMTALNAASSIYYRSIEEFLSKHYEGVSDEELENAHKHALEKANEQFFNIEMSNKVRGGNNVNGNGSKYKEKFSQLRREMISNLFGKAKQNNQQKKTMAKKDKLIKYASIGAGVTGVLGAAGAGVASALLVPAAGIIVAGTVLTKAIVVAAAVNVAGIVGVGTGVVAGAGAATVSSTETSSHNSTTSTNNDQKPIVVGSIYDNVKKTQ